MSWNGTVTCGYCGSSGHNKRGCPQLKADMEKRRATFGDDDYQVRHHESHRARTSRKGEKRSCTYCGEMGHNRRTCPTLGGHVARMQKASVVFRRQFVAALQTSGIGVGSLLTQKDWRDRQFRYLVTAINWQAVTAFDTRTGMPVYKVRDLANLTAGERACPAPEGFMPAVGRHDIKVLAPKASIEVPADFLAGLTVKQAKAHLKEQQAWYWAGSSIAQRCDLYTAEDTSTAT